MTSIVIGRTHIIKPFSLIGWALFAYGTGTLNILSTDTTIWDWIVLNIPSGAGIMLFASLALATQASADLPYAERMSVKAIAASLNLSFRSSRSSIWDRLCQAAFTNELSKRLEASVANDAAAFVEVIRAMPADDSNKASPVKAFVGSLSAVWWILFAMAAMMVILTFLTRDYEIVSVDEERTDLEAEKPRPQPTVVQTPRGCHL